MRILTIIFFLISVSVSAQRGLGEYLANSYTAGYWRLNGNSTDLSANANNGTDANITYGTSYGRFGQGASFNGSSSKISMPDNSSLRPASALTVSVWFKTSSTAQVVIAGNYNYIASGANGGDYGYQMCLYQNKLFPIVCRQSAVSYLQGATTINDGNWHNAILVWNGSNIYIYLDGKSDATPTSCASISYSTTMYPRIGYQDDSRGTGYYPFDGSIDEVIIESRAWSAQQIRNYYTQSKGRFTNN